MKKKIITFCIILLCLGINAQNIVVDYSVMINKEGGTMIDDVLDTFIFKLQANESESLFGLEDNLQIKEELNYSLAKAAIVDGYNEYYISKTNKNTITRKEFVNNFFIIDSELISYDWKITKESKKIKNFTCYKATRITQKTIHRNKKIVDIVVTAWFCPEINYSYGPIGNYGLPGLILELNKDRITYYVKKIEFNNDCITIKAPQKGEKVSEKQFKNIVKEFVEN